LELAIQLDGVWPFVPESYRSRVAIIKETWNAMEGKFISDAVTFG
jgi:hypothetical protein